MRVEDYQTQKEQNHTNKVETLVRKATVKRSIIDKQIDQIK